MRHVGHSIRSVAIEPLKLVLMRTHNHQVRTDVELLARGSAFRRFHPGATIHVRDADAINARGPAGQAVLNPVQEYRVEAPWFIMRIPGNSRETGPFVRALRRTRYSPPDAGGQSSSVAPLVMNTGPARNASAIFSASV